MYVDNTKTNSICSAAGNVYFSLINTSPPTSCVSVEVTCFDATKISKITLQDATMEDITSL
jgi:hypothetical protein